MSFQIRQSSRVPDAGQTPERPITQSVLRGLRRKCPGCGTGGLFARFLKTHHACTICGEELYHHRADDGPAYVTILVVGHIVVPVILAVEMAWHPPVWLQMAVWLPLTAVASLLLLEPFKGGFVGLQWALRLHGFDDKPADGTV